MSAAQEMGAAPSTSETTTTTTTTTTTNTETPTPVAGPTPQPSDTNETKIDVTTTTTSSGAEGDEKKEQGEGGSGEGVSGNNDFIFIMRISCELQTCGNIIGKGGDKIRKMTEESGASISLSDYIKGATHRIASIRGTRAAVIMATKSVGRALNEPKLVGNEVPTLTEPLKYLAVVLVVPKAHVGGIIGKQGAKIKQTRIDYSECKILISDKAMMGPDNTVTISGPTEKVEQLIEMFVNQIADHVSPGADYRLPPECVTTYSPPTPSPYGGGGGGGGPQGGGYNPYQRGAPVTGPSLYLGPSIGLTGQMKILVEFDANDVGTIMGRNGDRLRRISMETGASVTLPSTYDTSPTRVVTVAGPPKGVAAALHFIAVHIGLTRPHKGTGPMFLTLKMDPGELGSVIGKRGSRINAMRDESGARIEIDPKGGISIEGHSPNLAAGLMMVLMQLHEQREKFGVPQNVGKQSYPQTSGGGGGYQQYQPQSGPYQHM